MAIFEGDLRLLQSVNMADVPEGGGGPSGRVIPDGESNAIFPDVSDVDRTTGRVRFRKLSSQIAADVGEIQARSVFRRPLMSV